MEIKKYEIEEIRNNKEIVSKISNFIRETFSDIRGLYSENSEFKKNVEWDLETVIQKAENVNVFYVIENTTNDLIWCLWGIVRDDTENNVHIFYSMYVWTDKESRRLWIASELKAHFEKEAIDKTAWSKKRSIVFSRVNKNNETSQKRNLKNWYLQYDEGEGSEYFQFYKDIYPTQP